MKGLFPILFISLFVVTTPLFGQNQEPPKSIDEVAIDEAIRLEKLLKLEPHQAFYIDSILRHDMGAMQKEMDELKNAGVHDYNSFNGIREKWVQQAEDSFKKVLTEKQFITYLKDVGRYKKYKKGKK